MSLLAALTPGAVLLGLLLLALLHSVRQSLLAAAAPAQALDVLVFGALLVAALIFVQTDVTFQDLSREEVLRPLADGLLRALDSRDALWAAAYALAGLYLADAVMAWTAPGGEGAPRLLSVALAKQVVWLWLAFCALNEASRLLSRYSLLQSLRNLLWHGAADPQRGERERAQKAAALAQYGEDGLEAYHIGNQLYTFAEAEELCRIQGGRLASARELYAAQRHGADWLQSFGWSEGQTAYTVSPAGGLQGGPVEDASRLMGANCFGRKPKMTDRDRALMKELRMEARGLDARSQAKLLFAQLNPDMFATVRPFDTEQWNAFACESRAADGPPETDLNGVLQTQVPSLDAQNSAAATPGAT